MTSNIMMKKLRTVSYCAIAAALAVIGARTSLSAASTDAGAGNWQMITLTSPTQIAVAPPSQTSALDYQAELTAIKTAQANITDDQRKIIEYWSAGGVVRWNEILIGLVSKYNLPPAPAAQCSIDPPAKCPPPRISETPFSSSYVSPCQNLMQSSGRLTHLASSAWR